MPYPKVNSIETPILQELVAVGGKDNVRFLYGRLTAYFPQLTLEEINKIKAGTNKKWRKSVQKAGKKLEEVNLIKRNRGVWTITEKGLQLVEAETSGFTLTKSNFKEVSHTDIQRMLLEIGEILGFFSEMEVEYYDVVWRETEKSPRFSHIFEVQSKGNIDSAFAKLKRAYQTQRTKPFLILSSEKDLNRANKSLLREFSDIAEVTTILTFTQIQNAHKNLSSNKDIISSFLEI